MLYLAYLGVTGPLLYRRLTGWTAARAGDLDEAGRPVFTLGSWGVAINAVAVLYQATMVVNLLWPRTAVYDTTGHTWWLRWSAVLFIAATTAIGACYYAFTHRGHREFAAVVPVAAEAA
jgi:hypothetical protein